MELKRGFNIPSLVIWTLLGVLGISAKLTQVSVDNLVSVLHKHDTVVLLGEVHRQKKAQLTLLEVTNSDHKAMLEVEWNKPRNQVLVNIEDDSGNKESLIFPLPHTHRRRHHPNLLLVMGDLQQYPSYMQLYVDCESIGEDTLQNDLRKTIPENVNYTITVHQDISVYTDASVDKLLHLQGCSPHDQMQSDSRRRLASDERNNLIEANGKGTLKTMDQAEELLCQEIRSKYEMCYMNDGFENDYCLNGHCTYLGDCGCAAGWHGYRCDACCDLHCQNGATCTVHDGLKSCLCPVGFQGDLCEEVFVTPAPGTPDWVWWTIGAVCITALLIVLALGLALYYTWKRGRLPPALQKIIYYFKRYEDDDGLLHDAVLLASIEDITFVRYKLLPNLEEEMRMKVWIAHRDQQAGQAEAESWVEVISKSRRTILVVSRHYIEAEWQQFACQVAQYEMLKDNKHRIIPVILEKIPDLENIDSNLNYILQSVPCLKWPGEGMERKEKVFWEKLRLFMPKRRLEQDGNLDSPQEDIENPFGAQNGVLYEHCMEYIVCREEK